MGDGQPPLQMVVKAIHHITNSTIASNVFCTRQLLSKKAKKFGTRLAFCRISGNGIGLQGDRTHLTLLAKGLKFLGSIHRIIRPE